MANEKLKLSAPWVQYANAVAALFDEDDEVDVQYDEDETTVKIRVNNQLKADALTKLLPVEKEFGNVKLKINVIPANLAASRSDLFRTAFAGNRAVNDFITIEGVFTNPVTYMVFRKEVVQYWIDNMGDPHGIRSTLYQELAKEVLGEQDGIMFCTDIDE